jgi:hypothetical protein
MKYMLLCYDDAEAWERAGEDALREAMQEAVRLTHEPSRRGNTSWPRRSSRLDVEERARDATAGRT